MGKCEIPACVVEIGNVYYVEVPISDRHIEAGEPTWNRFRNARMPIATKMPHGVVLFTDYAVQTARGPAPENRREIAMGTGCPAWLLGALSEALLRTGDRLRCLFTVARCWVDHAADQKPPALPSEQDMMVHRATSQLMRNANASIAAAAQPAAPATAAGPSAAAYPGQKTIGNSPPWSASSAWGGLA